MRTNRQMRKNAGSVIAEGPFVLYVFFVLIVFPLIDLLTAFIRLTFIYTGTHQSCIWAARARTFQTSLNGDPTAEALAQAGADAAIGAFNGITLSITPQIVITDINTLKQTVRTTPLPAPADINKFTYQVQVVGIGSAAPLFYIPLPVTIPGLNAPLTMTLADRQYFENPSGLNN
jgi:hypothetical protein